MDKIVRYYFAQPSLVTTTPPLPKGTSPTGPGPAKADSTPKGSKIGGIGGLGGIGGIGGSGDRGNGGPAYGGGREHYIYSSDDTFSKVRDYLSRWQAKYLPHILCQNYVYYT